MSDGLPSPRPQKVLYVSWCPKDAIDGMSQLDVHEELAYRRVIDFIYTTGDRLEDDDRKLGIMTKLGTARWRKVKDALVNRYGKLQVVDGRITNARCREELVRVSERISQKVRAGKASAKARAEASENDADLVSNPLKNNETTSTDVGTGVATHVPTNHEPRVREDDDNARAREAIVLKENNPFGLSAEPLGGDSDDPAASGSRRFIPQPCPSKRDPNAWAIIQAMDEAVIAAYGWEIGEYTRHFKPRADWDNATALIKTGQDLRLTVEETIEGVREHLILKCRERSAAGGASRKVPSALSWFTESAADALVRLAKGKARAEKGLAPAGFSTRRSENGRPSYANGGDVPTSSAIRQPWQETQKRLVGAKRIDAARQLSAAAAQGNEAANRLAAELEGLHFAKKPAAAARAA